MTYARKSLISLNDTPYYHCIARCVRRAWLWGVDEYAGKDYSHRKAWVIERLQRLTRAFAIDVCAYAVMSNHYHLVLHVDRERARAWSDHHVVRRWKLLFRIPVLVQRYRAGELLSQAEQAAVTKIIQDWRVRLHDVSWFMRTLNEHLARRANEEDSCTGRFWEGRFKSQALLDESGLLTAMAYVDLNPIRAGSARAVEEAEFTSVYQRIHELEKPRSGQPRVRLMPLRGEHASSSPLAFRLRDYLELVDWTARTVRTEDSRHMERSHPPILTRLNIDATAWSDAMRGPTSMFGRALGRVDHLRIHAEQLQQCWIRGMRRCERLYRPSPHLPSS